MCVLDEIDRIPQAIDEFDTSARGRTEQVEIIILDNGSIDGTRDWLSSINRPDIRIVLNDKNIGKGGSIKRGIAMSRGAYIVIHDPDLEYRADDIWRLLDAVRKEGASLGLGSRLLEGKASYKYFTNYLGVLFLRWVINTLFGCRTTDPATAMKILNGQHARSITLDSDGFDLDFEIVTRTTRLGGNIIECPISYFPRTIAQGKKLRAYRDGFYALKAILRDRLRPAHHFVKSETKPNRNIDITSKR